MTTLHGLIFSVLDKLGSNLNQFWNRFRIFFYNHKTLFDIFFLFTYSFEQLLLFVLMILLPNYSLIIVGIFIVFFLFVIGFERICMESRYTDYKDKIRNMTNDYVELQELNRELREFIIRLLKKRKV